MQEKRKAVHNRLPYPNSASSRKIKKRAFRLIEQAKKPVLARLLGNAPLVWKEKDKEKSPQKWIIPPGV